MIELVVFDMAGTTVYDGDAVASCFRAALAAVGVTPEAAAVTAVMGLPKPEAVRRLLSAAGQTPAQDTLTAVHADFVERMRHYYATALEIVEIPGAAAAFAQLRQAGIKVALNTGFSRDIVDVLLGRLGWTVPAVIDGSIASDESPRGRPHPDMVQLLMRRFGIADARTVAKVGDTTSDLDEGTSAGCGLVIGVTTGSFTGEQLRQRLHTHILGSVAEVPGVVFGKQ